MFLKHKVIFIWLISLLVCLTGCSFLDPRLINTPIDLHKAGSVVETDFKIAQDDKISLQLSFLVNDQPGDRDRLLTFLGGVGQIGTPIPLKVQITKQADLKDTVILEKIYTTTGMTSAGSTELDRLIDELGVQPGLYRIRLETIEAFTQLSDTKVQFRIYYVRAHK